MGGTHVSGQPGRWSLTTAFTVAVKVRKWESQKNSTTTQTQSLD